MENRNAIEFRDVNFGYSDNGNNLESISFKVPIGSKVVITGESGCGKSTILKLISGLYFCNSGQVLVYGADIIKTDLDVIRNNISIVPQECQLFPVSILENITCGYSISLERVKAACEAAQLSDFISRLPDGIHTNIGEYGNKISGGERQRICIARAFAKNASLLLLDEPTSALDGQTEMCIMDYIDTCTREKTIVIVTHKIKNAINADLIIYMKNGRIIEAGTHTKLMGTDGWYTKLFNTQNMLEVLSR